MALPPAILHGTTPHELEFIAAEEIVTVVPTFSMERIRLMSGVYGPFRPPARSQVPLWFASDLKLKRKCYIVPPDWMSVEWLQEKLREETTADTFSKMPFRYIEISKILLDVAHDDITSSERVRNLLKDIQEARQAKLRAGLRDLDHLQLSIPNICAMEINELRPFFIKAMEVKGRLFATPLGDNDTTLGGTADATFGTTQTQTQSGWGHSYDMDTT
ncbi:DNA replication complex GINS protein SLD5 [Ceratobasidium sp. AG-Ba]|nr:DNA replication complex GINS protein SLD5 [Ceratobasidium sp. AG-Ba]